MDANKKTHDQLKNSDATDNMINFMKTYINGVISKNGINIDSIKQIFDEWTKIFGQKLCLVYAKPCFQKLYKDVKELNDLFDIEADFSYSFGHFFEQAFASKNQFLSQDSNEATLSMIQLQDSNLRVSLDCAMINAIQDSSSLSISASSSKKSFTATDITTKKQKNKASMRPDLWLADQYGRILLKGEHKSSDFHIGTAQLDSYSFELDRLLYENINATFGYVAAKAIVAFYIFDHKKKSTSCTAVNMISSYNLENITDRIKLIINVMSLSFVCRLIAMNNPSPLKINLGQWQIQGDNKSSIMYWVYNQFIKKVKINEQITAFSGSNGLHDLLEFYKLIRINRNSEPNLKYTVKCVQTEVDGGTFIVTTTPICDPDVRKHINDEKDLKIFLKCLLESVHSIHQAGYSHNDIRFANILYDPYHPFDCSNPTKGQFLLTDFERVRRLCRSKCREDHNHSTHERDYEFIRKEILNDIHITKISSSIANSVSQRLNKISTLLTDLDQLN